MLLISRYTHPGEPGPSPTASCEIISIVRRGQPIIIRANQLTLRLFLPTRYDVSYSHPSLFSSLFHSELQIWDCNFD